MADSNYHSILESLPKLLKEYFGNTIVWSQNGNQINGNYIYVRYDGKELGIFVGFLADSPQKLKCISFVFEHPYLNVATYRNHDDAPRSNLRLFYKILIKANLRLKKKTQYKLIRNGKSSAIVRSLQITELSEEKLLQFFKDSLDAIKHKEEILYKATSN